jgi:hypothetical protein
VAHLGFGGVFGHLERVMRAIRGKMARRQVETGERRWMWRLGTRGCATRLAILTPLAATASTTTGAEDGGEKRRKEVEKEKRHVMEVNILTVGQSGKK